MDRIVDIEGLPLRAPGLAQLEKPREIENHRQLREFRRLNARRADADPAMRLVRAIQELHENQQNKYHAERDENHARLAQLAVIEIHQREHSREAENHADDLPQKEGIAAAA